MKRTRVIYYVVAGALLLVMGGVRGVFCGVLGGGLVFLAGFIHGVEWMRVRLSEKGRGENENL